MAPEGLNEGYSNLHITFDASDGFVIDGLGQPWLLGGGSTNGDQQRHIPSSLPNSSEGDYYAGSNRSCMNLGNVNGLPGLPSHFQGSLPHTATNSNSREEHGQSLYMGYPGGHSVGSGLGHNPSLPPSGFLHSNINGSEGKQEYSHYCYVSAEGYDTSGAAASVRSYMPTDPTSSQPPGISGGNGFPGMAFPSSGANPSTNSHLPTPTPPGAFPPHPSTGNPHFQGFSEGALSTHSLPMALSPNIPPPSPATFMGHGNSLPGVGILAGSHGTGGYSSAHPHGFHGPHSPTPFIPSPSAVGMTYASYHDRPYPCSEPGCELRFVRSSHVKRHVDTVHRHLRPYQCKFGGCGKYFSRSDNLKQHEKTHQRSP